MPLLGEGALKNREDQKILGTDKEKSLYAPQDYFWTKLGQNCAVHGVCVDHYFFPCGYVDVASTGVLSVLSGGELYFYNAFDVNKQGAKFANDLQRTLARTFGFDALLRIRVSNGLKIEDYFGNFYMKNATDIECAGIDSLKAFTAVLKHDGKLDERRETYIQSALLYTTSQGQRRVRVHNLPLQNSSQYDSIFRNSSTEVTISVFIRQMIQQSADVSLASLRSSLSGSIARALASFRQKAAKQPAKGQLVLPEAMKLGPILALCVLKNRAFRAGNFTLIS